MKFITIAVTIFAVAIASTQAAPAFHKRSGGGLVNVEDVKVPVNVEVKDNEIAKNVKILSRRAVIDDTKVDVKDVNALSKNRD
ncbi:hypothetical protein KVV02_006594 [Mortierella alpina]|uniref:Uncharacterized protein n=1 Tax=Mortierella alpina TaxID=64518 RepID=A0A9P8A7W8_MORAP|nr:hypothetical protein KVV02_006594 [Mortierella alpina]